MVTSRRENPNRLRTDWRRRARTGSNASRYGVVRVLLHHARRERLQDGGSAIRDLLAALGVDLVLEGGEEIGRLG
jgi:hypothetical protein